jgi:CheY-like chemotaxis protein
VTPEPRQLYVLLIDDTQEILDLMAELLEEEGYRVTCSQALLDITKVKALAPDVIVQDLLFEGTQELGWKFLELVRLDPELAAQLGRQGIRVVLKPFTIEDLLRALRESLTAQALIADVIDARAE